MGWGRVSTMTDGIVLEFTTALMVARQPEDHAAPLSRGRDCTAVSSDRAAGDQPPTPSNGCRLALDGGRAEEVAPTRTPDQEARSFKRETVKWDSEPCGRDKSHIRMTGNQSQEY